MLRLLIVSICLSAGALPAVDARDDGDFSRLLGTGAVSTIEGASGSGIVPWATIGGYGDDEAIDIRGFGSFLSLPDYDFLATGVAVQGGNRWELSLSRQRLELDTLGPALGLSDPNFDMDVLGAKYRLGGDLLYGALPQFSLGAQYKRHRDFAVPGLVGAQHDEDIEVYLSASRAFLAAFADRHLVLNATARYSRANQGGLLGFGGDLNDDRELQVEANATLFLTRRLAAGIDYRQMPENLSFAPQDDWRDAFLAYFPNKRLAVTVAWVDLGSVAGLGGQSGWYLSAQGNF